MYSLAFLISSIAASTPSIAKLILSKTAGAAVATGGALKKAVVVVANESGRHMNENKLIRRLVLLWAVCVVTVYIFNPPGYINTITDAGAVAFVSVVGILSSVIGFYQWSRSSEEKRKDNEKDNTLSD